MPHRQSRFLIQVISIAIRAAMMECLCHPLQHSAAIVFHSLFEEQLREETATWRSYAEAVFKVLEPV